ncbi:hypothetical protein BS78_07G224000 [Paspalum vaginatum]|nr:hypothetical protein BS78_07G224000 [Paspalum vaginatum]
MQMAAPMATVITNAIDDGADASAGTTDHTTTRVQEELRRAAEKLEADLSNTEAKMHRYPASFRGLMSKDDRYFVPRCVAIGPYHHGAAHLQRAEEMKRAAAYFLCCDCEASNHSAEEMYAKILSVAGDARSCYDDDLPQLQEADFATMMFLDGCFLLQFIIHRTAITAQRQRSCLKWWFRANLESIHRDMFLLENQVPWPVLDALMALIPAPVGEFIADRARTFDAWQGVGKNASPPFVLNEESGYKPSHLLDLLRYYQSGLWKKVPASDRKSSRALATIPSGITSLPQCSSAIELAEIGVQLTSNRTAKFREMGLRRGLFFCKLFLAPLVMDDQNACWLLNMLALEVSSRAAYEDNPVRSYILLITMLMNREEDVHQLRAKRILHGSFSDQRTLIFVKNLAEVTNYTKDHTLLLLDLEVYRRKRWMWVALHKFTYNNLKSIVTVFSTIGVLVGIFKTLFSIEQHQQ